MNKKIVAITSCPVGVAHTYMAAESLEKMGREMGVDVKVETHGSIGVENKLTAEEIDAAEGVIIAADTDIDKSRFAGKRLIEVPVRGGIDRAQELIQNILDGKGQLHTGQGQKSETSADNVGSSSIGHTIYRSIMNGVSFMVPFVVTGGLLIAIALSLGGVATEGGFVIPEDSFWLHINNIGGAAMGFMVPILAGYTAYSIAERPGLVPGMVGGFIAVNGSFYGSEANTGFIGGIIAGILAGYVAKAIKSIKVPKAMQTVMPVIFIPVFSSLIVGLLFIFLIGAPIAQLFTGLTSWLASLQGASQIILALILGAMIAVDMGGPFNKTAFLFGSGLIAEGTFNVMGAVAVAICIPPIAMGVATRVYKNKFTEEDRSAGTASFLMGLFGITEGAIPFAAKDPLKVIPAIVGGSMAGSVVAMISGVGGHVAHGGPIVAALGAIDNVFGFALGVLVGVVVAVLLIGVLKKDLVLAQAPTSQAPVAKATSTPAAADTSAESASVEEKPEVLALSDLTNTDLINLSVTSATKPEAIKELLDNPAVDNYITDKQQVLEAVLNRETQSTTGIGSNLAIPHAKSDAIKEARVLYGYSQAGVDWDSLDGEPAKLIFMILVPTHAKGDTHLKILQMLSRTLVNDDFKARVMNASSQDEVLSLFEEINNAD